MITYLLVFALSLFTVALSIKPLITVAIRKRLFDAPSESRKIHKRIIPNLGGLAIFTGFLLAAALFVDISSFWNANYILAAGVIIFIIGLKDDLIGVDPMKKFAAQFLAAFLVTILADIRIMNLGGLFGIHELAYPFSVGLSIFLFVGFINAYNLVDGIDGLAGFLGLMTAFVYAALFYYAGYPQWTYLCLALAGALVGFLIHNVSPARIFMGDCGSLLLGFMVAALTIQFINVAGKAVIEIGSVSVSSAPALALSIAVLPVFDTIRVFTIRILNNQSPFKADRNHMHHRMLALGMNHMQATATLVSVSLVFIATAFFLQKIGNNQLFATLILVIILLNTTLSIYLYSKKILDEVVVPGSNLNSAGDRSGKPNGAGAKFTSEGNEFAEKVLREVSTEMDQEHLS